MRASAIIRFGINGFFIFLVSIAQAQSPWQRQLLSYINHHARADGGYGWPDQPDSHLTPTYAVIGILKDISQLPSNRERLLNFVKTQHPQRGINREAGPSGTEMRNLVYEQIQSVRWLNGKTDEFQQEVLGWKPQNNKVSNFEEHGYPVFIQELMTPVCRSLLNLPLTDVSDHFKTYIQSRKRANGSYNNTKRSDGGDGNILNTYWGIYASRVLHDTADKEKTADWIKNCQRPSGAFTYQPLPFTEDNGEVAYTWAAVKSLCLLSATPSDVKACIRYLLSLRNEDGGFGNRLGLPSTPEATYYAVDALKELNALNALDTSRYVNKLDKTVPEFSGLKVYTVQFEAHGSGSPAEAVMLAQRLGIHLWGIKNGHNDWKATKEWMATAQKIAADKKVPVTFFYSDESYGSTAKVEGLGEFSHILDYIAPDIQNRTKALDGSSWKHVRTTFIEPLKKENGALILQVTNNEPLARVILDESVKKGGYAGISTIHFGQNFLFWLPFLYQYRYQLPFVSLQDAHGNESWWWSKELTSHRTLFLGNAPTYSELMKALKNNWVVAVRHDSLSKYKTRMLGGANGVQEYVKSKEKQWAWWNDNTKTFNDAYGVITLVTPKDTFETACPQQGVNIRVRCAWNGSRQFLESPAVVLEQLIVDNKVVKPEYVEIKDRRGSFMDSYYVFKMPEAGVGVHHVKGIFRSLRYGTTKEISEQFAVGSQ